MWCETWTETLTEHENNGGERKFDDIGEESVCFERMNLFFLGEDGERTKRAQPENRQMYGSRSKRESERSTAEKEGRGRLRYKQSSCSKSNIKTKTLKKKM